MKENCAVCGQPLTTHEEKDREACTACYELEVCPEALQEWLDQSGD